MKCKNLVFLSLISSLIMAALATAQTNSSGTTKGDKQPDAKRSAQTASASNEGEKRFQTNCGRCHNPPESISPREVRAVARHMRVRAMLTAEDEKLIIEFLAP
jgi:cytochrome c5